MQIAGLLNLPCKTEDCYEWAMNLTLLFMLMIKLKLQSRLKVELTLLVYLNGSERQ